MGGRALIAKLITPLFNWASGLAQLDEINLHKLRQSVLWVFGPHFAQDFPACIALELLGWKQDPQFATVWASLQRAIRYHSHPPVWLRHCGREFSSKTWQQVLPQAASAVVQCGWNISLDGSTIHRLDSHGQHGGTCTKRSSAFKPSQRLIEKRKARRSTADPSARKQLSFEIQRMHRQELRAWKSTQISQHLQNPCTWKELRSLEKHPVRTITAPPHPNDFADMLETLFAGNTISPQRPVTTTEDPWQRSDLTKAIQRMKTQKAADERGLVAELLKHVPEDVLTKLLALMNDLLL